MDVFQFFGRLHPLVLHLPIGILAIGFLMEWIGRKEKYTALLPAVGFVIQVGMWSAILAAVSGFILSYEGGYNETTLNRHQWLGIGTAVISVVLYFLHRKKKSAAGKKFYFPVFVILMLLLMITGHLGGSLTHGSDFLTEPFLGEKQKQTALISNMDSALVFQDLIQPIFKQKCVSCHNEDKIKGKLLMTTIEGIQSGGKTGAFFTAGDVENSLFLQRVHLPIEEKKHMPPKGKKQLTKNEITLLQWWVQEGATFNKKIIEVERTEEIKSILAKYAESEQSVFTINVTPPNQKLIHQFNQAGILTKILSKEKPFVTISLRGQKDLNKNTINQLRKVKEQLIELDLSETNMNDDLLPYLREFPHLQKLFLQKTKVTGKNLNTLSGLKYLEYLNLYDTPIEDDAIESIAKIASLQNLYLWQSNVSPTAIQQLKNDRPLLQINSGIDNNIFGNAELKPPVINVAKDIFTDSVLVNFDINFKGVNLFYTLDGTLPDSTSKKYTTPFNLTQTANIQVIAQKEGWKTSPPAEKTVVRARYKANNIQLNKSPNDKYKADGAASLINLKKGTINFAEGEWLGYEKSGFTATLDMGELMKLSGVSVSALESTASYIFFPKEIKILVSKDGKGFQEVAQKSIPTTSGPAPAELKNFTLKFDLHNAQYVKVEVKSNLFNPSWHPAPGAPCWIFVDEIMVE